ncbi:MAG: hypothetical protein GKR89_08220 [Candidatus Latescibacteria bacterium]|nr:hypothetical protein [Candidatus Latescibacterota bacterium]
MPAIAQDRASAQAVRDTLGLPGWTPWWRFSTDEDGTFNFELTRPGKHYDMHLSPDGDLRVEEYRTGFWSVVNSLHATMRIPNAPLISWWGVYTELCFWVVLGSAGTGIYLWWRLTPRKGVGYICLASVGASPPAPFAT